MEVVWRLFWLTAKRAVQFSDAEKGIFQLIRKKGWQYFHSCQSTGRKEQWHEFGHIGRSTPDNFGKRSLHLTSLNMNGVRSSHAVKRPCKEKQQGTFRRKGVKQEWFEHCVFKQDYTQNDPNLRYLEVTLNGCFILEKRHTPSVIVMYDRRKTAFWGSLEMALQHKTSWYVVLNTIWTLQLGNRRCSSTALPFIPVYVFID